LASGAAYQRCDVRRRKRVEDDREKEVEEEARVKDLRARSRPRKGKADTHIRRGDSGMARDNGGGRIPISQPKKKKRRKRLQKHKGLESGGCSVAPFSLLHLLPPLVPPPIPLAQMLCRVLM
jgi:hypothetical protein